MAVLLNVIANAIQIEFVNSLLKWWQSKAKPKPDRPNQGNRFIFVFLWFSPGTSVSFTNKTDRHDIAEILLKVTYSTIIYSCFFSPYSHVLSF